MVARSIGVVVLVLALLGACAGDDPGDDGSNADGPRSSGATTTVPADHDFTVVSLNMLHGLPLGGDCPPETESCRADVRMAILWEEIESAGCPDAVMLQEVGPAQRELLPERLPELCDGAYELASEWVGLPVDVAILSSVPVLDHRGVRLSGINWAAHWARLDSGLGPVEIATAHFASSADPFACADVDDYCGELCDRDGTPGDCHPLELLDLFEQGEGEDTAIQVATGDFNRPVTDPRVTTLLDAGFVDTWTLGGNPQCDPGTGEGCTCCISGEGPLGGLDVAEQNAIVERIDFVLARAAEGCELRADSRGDTDGDGTSTGPFARDPRSEALDGIYWASDHTGVQADLSCSG